MDKQELKNVMERVFGANVFSSEITDKYEIKQRSIRNEEEAKTYLKDLKANGYYTRKKSFNEFVYICGIKPKGI